MTQQKEAGSPAYPDIPPEVTQPRALELIERAQIDMQITTARKYPRDLAKVKRQMLSFATLDEETAESCFYTLRRKDSDGGVKLIQGPSVRLAEIAVACYGNLRAASRVIDNDGKTVTSQGVCHDLENNTLISCEVKRRITDKRGRTYSEDMQVVTGNAANSIAVRNAIFKVIPGALIKPVFEAAKGVAIGTASTLTQRRAKILKRLDSMGVDQARILSALGKSSVENIGVEDLETLIGIGTAIRDGDTTIEEAFPALSLTEAARAGQAIAEDKIAALRSVAEQIPTADSAEPLGEASTAEQAPEFASVTAPAPARPAKLTFGRRIL